MHCHSRDHGAKSTREAESLEGQGQRGVGTKKAEVVGAVQTQVSFCWGNLRGGGVLLGCSSTGGTEVRCCTARRTWTRVTQQGLGGRLKWGKSVFTTAVSVAKHSAATALEHEGHSGSGRVNPKEMPDDQTGGGGWKAQRARVWGGVVLEEGGAVGEKIV